MPKEILKELQKQDIDFTVVEPILDYAVKTIDIQILKLRDALSKITEYSLRHEYLGRIDSLQMVKSQLSITQLAELIGKLNNVEEQKLNAY